MNCCGHQVNELVGIGSTCMSAELKSSAKRIYELAMMDDVLAVNCKGYLESVQLTQLTLKEPPLFKEEMLNLSRGIGR
jgi:hypothetical protein